MRDKGETWERRSIELPPGWHGVMPELSRLTDVKLKYLYSVAIDAMLGHGNLDRVVKAAWELQRQTREDIEGVGARHTKDSLRA